MADGSATDGSVKAGIVAALPRLRRFCWALAGNAEDGDDLMQATVERALNRAHQFEQGTQLGSWLFRIARNLRIDAARSTARRGVHVGIDEIMDPQGDDGRELLESRSDLAAAQRALLALPEDQRAAFVLVVIEGMTYREAADVLEVPLGTIMSRLARARGRIEQVIGRKQGGLQ